MYKIIDFIDSILMKMLSFIIVAIAVIVIISVALRYLFGISYVWLQEIIVFMFIFTTFFGSVVAYKRNEHLAIDIFYKKFSYKTKTTLNIIFNILIFYLNFQIIRISLKWIDRVGNVVAPGMRFPMNYIYIILPMSAFLMSIYILADIFQKIKDFKS